MWSPIWEEERSRGKSLPSGFKYHTRAPVSNQLQHNHERDMSVEQPHWSESVCVCVCVEMSVWSGLLGSEVCVLNVLSLQCNHSSSFVLVVCFWWKNVGFPIGYQWYPLGEGYTSTVIRWCVPLVPDWRMFYYTGFSLENVVFNWFPLWEWYILLVSDWRMVCSTGFWLENDAFYWFLIGEWCVLLVSDWRMLHSLLIGKCCVLRASDWRK